MGGIAVETVTEDAHTALKMSRHGYNTAYLAIPQAAGLATESLSGHIGQRIRWARGMAQICRVDNPLFGPGLKLGQRLCYLNAMLHFFYGLPRLIFLTAPLAYLLFDIQIFEASALMITAYAMPHILHAVITNSRVQGQFRHSFWNEVYESVLAWYILRPVLIAFLKPKLGKFNVTAKGGVIDKAYFDWGMARPYLLMLLLNLAGFVAGCLHLAFSAEYTTGLVFTMFINLLWTFYNMLILSASIAAASETRQVRDNPRVPLDLPATLRLPDGRAIACQTANFSQGGLGLALPDATALALHMQVGVSLYRNGEEAVFPAEVVFLREGRVGLQLGELTTAQQIDFARMTFARADLWTQEWGKTRRDAPLAALATVFRTGARGFLMLFRHLGDTLRALRKGEHKRIQAKFETGDR
ncbi:MAG: Cellulose synthase catalytic subunit [UDP-forming] [Paracidovorax wautersii]|uniref:Cellulose synthase catalytic subunit [UDP-forming] n=1 Tax=Paracidovorax wautersii TaxID=1177982 RepID=A0A7V8FP17_9BURK|nr:MAG: Cellulose synthase catalytic subunit [UDP-forming] [Paracidovorax wautersii]